MGIPESQLDTWSHQGSIAQSASTYSIIKNALESANTKYHGKNFKVFLQGSYGNDTNIYAESDVDVVICLDDVYYSDLTQLSPEDKDAYDRAFVPATYSYTQFKQDVLEALTERFGSDVKVGDKAIVVAAMEVGAKLTLSHQCSFVVIGNSRGITTHNTMRASVSLMALVNGLPITPSSIQKISP